MNWSRGVGGGGAIDLVIHLKSVRFAEALDWLGRYFSDYGPPSSAAAAPHLALPLPPPDPNQLGRATAYLVLQRAIPANIVDRLVHSGALFADARANAVFLLLGRNNAPVGAELRGTTGGTWRGMAPGSRKDLGFFAIGPDPACAIVLCESAIDAISCFTLHSEYRCVSTAGARANPAWLAPLFIDQSEIYCGFDADSTGDRMADEMIALYPAVKRLRPSLHDWNDVLSLRT